jgi:hypothetical protein
MELDALPATIGAKDVTLPKIMKEGRKYGIVVVVASQSLPPFWRGRLDLAVIMFGKIGELLPRGQKPVEE